jgi:hypothetical protein
MDSDPAIASQKLQTDLLIKQNWFKNEKWKVTDPSNFTQYSLHEEKRAPVHINNVRLPQEDDVKNLRLHLDRWLTWHKHIYAKRKQPGITLRKYIAYLDASQNSPQAISFYI